MSDKILFVDDEPAVLEGYRRLLHKEFSVDTALGAQDGLAAIAAAQEDARKVVASAEQEIAAAVKAARRELTAHAADLAVDLAQKKIRVDAATDQALVRSFSAQLSKSSENPGKDKN